MPKQLSKPVYESLPLFWALAGLSGLVVSYRLRATAWSTALALASLVCIVVAIVLWLHRRDYRATSAQYTLRGQPMQDRDAPPE